MFKYVVCLGQVETGYMDGLYPTLGGMSCTIITSVSFKTGEVQSMMGSLFM